MLSSTLGLKMSPKFDQHYAQILLYIVLKKCSEQCAQHFAQPTCSIAFNIGHANILNIVLNNIPNIVIENFLNFVLNIELKD